MRHMLVLDIKVVKCTGLKRADGPSGKKADPYVIIEVDDGNEDVSAVVATTNFKEHTLEPIYNTAFSFHVDRDFMRKGTVTVRVCHHDHDGGQLMGETKLPFPKLVNGENKLFIHYGKLLCGQVTLTVQKAALLTMYQNILKMEQKLNLPSKHTSYVDNEPNSRTLGLITPRTEGDLSRLPVYAPKPFVTSELKKKGAKKDSKMASYSEAGEKRSGLFGFVKALVLFGAVTVGSVFATAAIPEDNDITVNARKMRDTIKTKSKEWSKVAAEKAKSGSAVVIATGAKIGENVASKVKEVKGGKKAPPVIVRVASKPQPTGPFGSFGKKLYKVQAGDTLSVLAFEQGTSVEKIMRLNNMTNFNIQVGNELRVR
mmetsp:Transcript_26332/g.44087  ORF Transcript_26332/g.44087 Transcript_26332/m.44087 type:complete len:371 (+) Transcript_26332:82-1194(+)